jgi:hypothetical protein
MMDQGKFCDMFELLSSSMTNLHLSNKFLYSLRLCIICRGREDVGVPFYLFGVCAVILDMFAHCLHATTKIVFGCCLVSAANQPCRHPKSVWITYDLASVPSSHSPPSPTSLPPPPPPQHPSCLPTTTPSPELLLHMELPLPPVRQPKNPNSQRCWHRRQ